MNSNTALLDKINDTQVPFDDTKTVLDLFEECVKSYPDNIALIYEERKYTYVEVDEITTRLACQIKLRGGSKGQRAAVLVPRCEYMPIVPLALFKAGMAYVPLDFNYPSERLRYIISDSDSQMVIVTESELELVNCGCNSMQLPQPENCSEIMSWDDSGRDSLERACAEDLFTVLYTSGTTGEPKGALITHKSPIVLSDFMRRKFQLTSSDVFGTYSGYGFDACSMDMFLALTCGGSLCIVPQKMKLVFSKMNKYLNHHKVSFIFLPTAVGSQYVSKYDSGSLRCVLLGGEKLMPLKCLYDDCQVYNIYGPTEAYVFNFCHLLTDGEENIPVGKPNDNTRLYVLSENSECLGPGKVGEIYISTPQLAVGYLNKPELNEELFVRNPYGTGDYSLMYRTGDLGYYDEMGFLYVVGRKDTQVKINGNRLELTEVEAVIKNFPDIDDATVDAKQLENGRKILVAYVTSKNAISVEELYRFVGERKPSYMIPAAVIQLDAIPLTANGKVDRHCLPVPTVVGKQTYVAPRCPLEQELCDAFSAILGVFPVGIDDDIVEFGGDSLSIMTILDMCKLIKGLTAQILISQGTPRKITECLMAANAEEEKMDMSVRPDYPTFGIQEEYYDMLESVPENMFLHVEKNLVIDNDIDVERLHHALEAAINNHPGLKATFRRNDAGEPRMYRHDDAKPVVESVVTSEDNIENVKDAFMVPFDLANGPLYHIQIVTTESAKYLLMDFHHFLVDGPSLDIFLEDVSAVYMGDKLINEEWTVFEVSLFENNQLESELYNEGKQWYESTFAHLNCDKLPKGDVGRDDEPTQTGRLFVPLGITKAELETSCKKMKTTPAILTGAAYARLMAKYTGQDEVLFVTVSNGRDHSQKSRALGSFSKGEPVYCKTSQTTDRPVDEMKKLRLSCIEHNTFPYTQLSITPRLGNGHFFLYQANFAKTEFCGKPIRSFTIRGDEAYFGLLNEIWCDDAAVDLYYSMIYKSNIYTEAFARQYISDYISILRSMML